MLGCERGGRGGKGEGVDEGEEGGGRERERRGMKWSRGREKVMDEGDIGGEGKDRRRK